MSEDNALTEELAKAVARALTDPAIDAICQARIAPMRQRTEDVLAELERTRVKLEKHDKKAVQAYAVRRGIEKGVKEAEERAEKERKRANRYQQRAYKAEGKLKQLADGELDPYEYLSGIEPPQPSTD